MAYRLEGSRPAELVGENELALSDNEYLRVRRTIINDPKQYLDMAFGPFIIESIVSLSPGAVEIAERNKEEQLNRIHEVVDSHHLMFATLEAFVLDAGLEPLLYCAYKSEINPPSGTVAARMGASASSLDAKNTTIDFDILPDHSLGEFALARPKNPGSQGRAYLGDFGYGMVVNVVTGFEINWQRDFGERVVPAVSCIQLPPVKYIKFVKR